MNERQWYSLALFGLMLAMLAVRRWRDGKPMRPTKAGVDRWVVLVLVALGIALLFTVGLLVWASQFSS